MKSSEARTLVLLGLDAVGGGDRPREELRYTAGPSSSGVATWSFDLKPIDGDGVRPIDPPGWHVEVFERRQILRRVAWWTYLPSGVASNPHAVKPYGPTAALAAFASLDGAARAAIARYPRDRLDVLAAALRRACRHYGDLQREYARLESRYAVR